MQFHADDAVLLDEFAALFRGCLGKGRSVAAIITSHIEAVWSRGYSRKALT